MRKKIVSLLGSLALAVALCGGLLTFTGCQSLDPAGVYQGDKTLYNADLVIAMSYDSVHAFVTWEYTNRAALTGTPQARESANYLRLNYPLWHRAALAARTAYMQSKTAANANALDLTLSVLRNAMTQAQQWLADASSSSAAATTPILGGN